MKPTKRYYAYTLADDFVFYVGKGQGRRVYEHEKEAMRAQIQRAYEIAAYEGISVYRIMPELKKRRK